MKRRTFLRAGAAAIGSTALASAPGSAADSSDGEVYELNSVSALPGKQAILDEFLERALVPAYKRSGAGPIGVFNETAGKDGPRTFVLAVHPSANHVLAARARLASDREYFDAARPYLSAPPTEKVHGRIESSLLRPIAGMPRLEKPDASKPRILNLRVYRSHNGRAAAKKVEMFNTAELAIFRRVGLAPVFFASAVVGPDLPNLTYMLVFPDDAARQAAWARFVKDSEWLKLKAMPNYADKEIISEGITNGILMPAAYSDI
jgi:hypothetical protein